MICVIIDVQEDITTPALYAYQTFITNVKVLIEEARANGVEVVYVRHDDGEGHSLHKGNAGFEIYHEIAPTAQERIFDKHVNSAFKESGLLEYLSAKKENTVLLCGLQTDYCMDASVKAAFEHGFQVIVPQHANTTVSNAFLSAEKSYHYYNDFMWNHRYAQCVDMPEALTRIRACKEI